MSEYIDRESLINHLNQSAAEYYSRAVERVIELEPAADVAPVRRGQWIEEKNTFPGFNLANNVCSECGVCTLRPRSLISPFIPSRKMALCIRKSS